jgi:hypothetical protein
MSGLIFALWIHAVSVAAARLIWHCPSSAAILAYPKTVNSWLFLPVQFRSNLKRSIVPHEGRIPHLLKFVVPSEFPPAPIMAGRCVPRSFSVPVRAFRIIQICLSARLPSSVWVGSGMQTLRRFSEGAAATIVFSRPRR